MIQNELTHVGVLGMKWGVRRFQNKDGSLNKAGTKRKDRLEQKIESEKKYAKEHVNDIQKIINKGSGNNKTLTFDKDGNDVEVPTSKVYSELRSVFKQRVAALNKIKLTDIDVTTNNYKKIKQTINIYSDKPLKEFEEKYGEYVDWL